MDIDETDVQDELTPEEGEAAADAAFEAQVEGKPIPRPEPKTKVTPDPEVDDDAPESDDLPVDEPPPVKPTPKADDDEPAKPDEEPAKPAPTPMDVAKERADKLAADAATRDREAVNAAVLKAHPNAGTINDAEIRAWAATQTTQVQSALFGDGPGNAADIIDALNKFYADTKTGQAHDAPPDENYDLPEEDGTPWNRDSIREASPALTAYVNKEIELAVAKALASVRPAAASGSAALEARIAQLEAVRSEDQMYETLATTHKHPDARSIESNDTFRKEWLPAQGRAMQLLHESMDPKDRAALYDAYKSQHSDTAHAAARAELKRKADLRTGTLSGGNAPESSTGDGDDPGDYEDAFDKTAKELSKQA